MNKLVIYLKKKNNETYEYAEKKIVSTNAYIATENEQDYDKSMSNSYRYIRAVCKSEDNKGVSHT